MRIKLAKARGFCFGVERAIKIAKKEAQREKEVFILKDIVHNEEVMKDLKELGIKRLRNLKKIKVQKTLIISAHGESSYIINKARKFGYRIVDATCPMVKHIHRIVKSIEKRKRKLIIIGDKGHTEVLGILGQITSKAMVIDPKEKLNLKELKKINSASVVVQSTQDLATVMRIKSALSKYIADFEFYNTICKFTLDRQRELEKISRENDLVLIIGSKKSANTKRLYEISKKINKNTYWINSPRQLNRKWFKGVKSIGITSGASTPEDTIIETVSELFGKRFVRQSGNCFRGNRETGIKLK